MRPRAVSAAFRGQPERRRATAGGWPLFSRGRRRGACGRRLRSTTTAARKWLPASNADRTFEEEAEPTCRHRPARRQRRVPGTVSAELPTPAVPDSASTSALPEMPSAGLPVAAGAPAAMAGPLGSLTGPLGGLLTGAAQAGGQRAASTGQPARARVDKSGKDKADPGAAGEREKKDARTPRRRGEKDPAKAASGDNDVERTPIRIEMDVVLDRLDAPVTMRVYADNPPASNRR